MHTKANTLMRRLKPFLCLGALALAQQAFAAVPKIWSAQINSPANVITIIGQHFAPASGSPVVTLDSSPLTLQAWSDTTIVANSPVGLGPGSYLLTVSNGLVVTFEVANYPLFGTNTSAGVEGTGATCTLGEVSLYAGAVVNGIPAEGQLLPISGFQALFALLGNKFGGDGVSTFALPDLRGVAPNGLTYAICTQGVFPSAK